MMKKYIKTFSMLSLTYGLLLQSTVVHAEDVALRLDRLQQSVNAQKEVVINLDLLRELKRQYPKYNSTNLELRSVKFTAKAGLGGGNAYLVINNEYTDSQLIETDPARMLGVGGFANFQLVNLERNVGTAVLNITGDVKLNSVVMDLGQAVDVAVLGNYGPRVNPAVAQTETAVAPAPSTPPTVVVVNTPGAPSPVPPVVQPARPASPTPAVPPPPQGFRPGVNSGNNNSQAGVRPTPPPPPAPVVAQKCLQDFCIGETVINAFKFKGKIVAIDFNANELLIKWSYSEEVVARRPDQIRKAN